MKTFLLLAAIATFQFATAQKTYELDSFNKIAISGDADMELQLVKSSENKLVISGADNEDLSDDFRVSSAGGYLAISNDYDDLEMIVYYTDDINEMTVSGDVEITCEDTIKSRNFMLSANSDVVVQLKVDTNNFTLVAASDAEITLSGSARNFNAAVASDAELNGNELKTKNNCSIAIASDGEASIYCKGNVDATVASDGELTIYGNPRNVNESKSSDAEITIMR
ncbi:head GIN domain-containing protein [Flavobacterium litorale]|uniref:DUF2807 domain-containing protein n=1 Tax=Flavobacterium litorale TaxID=2856519 RepID=A0ABX8VEG8_9FLAO|nr:head GIN domain-containing protein [Flavobacterium litorale]QYJ69039.1 DUF2807 domain-containing protein [Flavobacterium litorale]